MSVWAAENVHDLQDTQYISNYCQCSCFRYWALPHERQPLSVSNRFAKLKSAKKRFISDGLNSVAFRLVAREFHRLYTNLTVELLPPSVGTHGSDHPEDVHLDVGA